MGLKKRLGAFLLCGVIAFHSVCFYTPPAKAAVLESMLANMCLSTFMTATGISLVPDDKTSERLCQALDALVPDFVTDYAAEVGEFTVDAFNSAISQDCVIQTTGLLQIGHQAAALMAKFTAWLIDEFSLTRDVAYVVPLDPIFTTDGIPLTFAYIMGMPNVVLTPGISYDFASGYKIVNYKTSSGYVFEVYKNGTYKASFGGVKNCYALALPINVNATECTYLDENNNVVNSEIGFSYGTWTVLGINATPDIDATLEITLAEDYDAPPEVDEQYAMVVNTGLTYEDEQSYIDAVLNGVAAGTLSPTYTIEETTTGDVTVPDEGEDTDDTQVGILDWTKKIWQSVKELPGELMDALTNVFVPSAEYLEALPATVAATFDGRTGFLTYPISVLADFVGRLNDTGNDWIIEWPDIYEPFSNGRLISKGQFNVSEFVRSDQTISSIYSTWMLITKAFLIFMFLDLCSKKYSSVIGDRLE